MPVVVVVTFSLSVRTLGECWTIHSPPPRFCLFFHSLCQDRQQWLSKLGQLCQQYNKWISILCLVLSCLTVCCFGLSSFACLILIDRVIHGFTSYYFLSFFHVRKTTSGNGQAWSSASPRGQWNREKMEKTGCEIICGAPTTLTVKGLIRMMLGYSYERNKQNK